MPLLNRLRDESFRTACLTAVSGLALLASFLKWLPQLPFDPAWIAVMISGLPIVYGAVKGLVTEWDVTADVLVAIALVAALAIRQYFAAGEVAFIMQLGKVLEDVTADRAHKGLQALIGLSPQTATLRTGDGERQIAAADVKAGDLLLVRPGETVPVDGRIVRGSTSVDQSVMTGESVPVDLTVGDEVYQGTTNLQGAIDLEAIRVDADSALERMIRLVEEAEQNKAPIVRIADRWARILVPIALGCAGLIWLLTGDLSRGVTALVVFCPCALILATPTAMMAAIGNATRNGILIKSGAAVEATAKLDTLVLDKTGTMTCGELQVEEVRLLDRSLQAAHLLRLLAAAEKFSEHPVGKAIVRYARAQGVTAPDPDSFEMQAGRGVRAELGGQQVLVGEKVVGQARITAVPQAEPLIEQLQQMGKTVLPVAVEGKLVALVVVADALREETGPAVAALRANGLSHLVMLTGDNQAVAEAIAGAAGVTDILASRLPDDKVAAIESLKAGGRTVGMIGDGVNDAPALAAASVGIVMGAIGSDVAIAAADVALMGDDLGKLPFLVRLCRATERRIVFNIVVSMLINLGAIAAAGLGWLNPVTAALVHNAGSVFVVVSSALLLSYSERSRPACTGEASGSAWPRTA